MKKHSVFRRHRLLGNITWSLANCGWIRCRQTIFRWNVAERTAFFETIKKAPKINN